MGEMIRFDTPGGQQAPGYLATPGGGEDAPNVVVIQEWWGLNDQIKRVADRLAAQGYRALVPDLYRGRVTQNPDEANHMMSGLDWAGATDNDVRGAARHLRRNGRRTAVIGFCMGGALTIIAAVKVPESDAGVCFYGIPPSQMADPAQIRVPIQFHFANQDDWCTPAAVDKLEEQVRAAGIQHELFRYDAQHAFFNEENSAVYDPAAAREAWERTLGFLQAHL